MYSDTYTRCEIQYLWTEKNAITFSSLHFVSLILNKTTTLY